MDRVPSREVQHSLTVFEDNAKELAQSAFIRWMNLHQETTIHYEKGKRDTLPRYESVKAFLLTFRKFMQNNEACSIANMEKIYSRNCIPRVLKDEFSRIRGIYNEHLDQPLRMKVYKNKERTHVVLETKRDLLDTIMYGKFAHSHPEKFYISKAILKDEFFRLILWPEFIWDIYVCHNLIQHMRKNNKKIMKVFKQCDA